MNAIVIDIDDLKAIRSRLDEITKGDSISTPRGVATVATRMIDDILLKPRLAAPMTDLANDLIARAECLESMRTSDRHTAGMADGLRTAAGVATTLAKQEIPVVATPPQLRVGLPAKASATPSDAELLAAAERLIVAEASKAPYWMEAGKTNPIWYIQAARTIGWLVSSREKLHQSLTKACTAIVAELAGTSAWNEVMKPEAPENSGWVKNCVTVIRRIRAKLSAYEQVASTTTDQGTAITGPSSAGAEDKSTAPDQPLSKMYASLTKSFEQGYAPHDEPPGVEELMYEKWLKSGGQVRVPPEFCIGNRDVCENEMVCYKGTGVVAICASTSQEAIRFVEKHESGPADGYEWGAKLIGNCGNKGRNPSFKHWRMVPVKKGLSFRTVAGAAACDLVEGDGFITVCLRPGESAMSILEEKGHTGTKRIVASGPCKQINGNLHCKVKHDPPQQQLHEAAQRLSVRRAQDIMTLRDWLTRCSKCLHDVFKIVDQHGAAVRPIDRDYLESLAQSVDDILSKTSTGEPDEH